MTPVIVRRRTDGDRPAARSSAPTAAPACELPDNSIEAFEAAIESGCEMIETDVRADRQGRPVLSHDRLRPISPGDRPWPPALPALRAAGRGRDLGESRAVSDRAGRARGAAGAVRGTDRTRSRDQGGARRTGPARRDRGLGRLAAADVVRPGRDPAVRERDPARATGLIAGPMHIGDPLADALACDAQALMLAERRLTAKLLATPVAAALGVDRQPAGAADPLAVGAGGPGRDHRRSGDCGRGPRPARARRHGSHASSQNCRVFLNARSDGSGKRTLKNTCRERSRLPHRVRCAAAEGIVAGRYGARADFQACLRPRSSIRC